MGVLLGLVASCAVGCASETSEGEEGDGEQSAEAISEAEKTCDGWDDVGLGVSYKNVGGGNAIFIAYGGYSAQGRYSCAWSMALHAARLRALGVGHVFGVKGPRDAGYGAREIGNSKLNAKLAAGGAESLAAKAPFILVAAHSSGSYVANEFFGQVRDDATLHKTVYANLDGGGIDGSIVRELRRVAFVYAEDTTLSAGRSSNAGTMESLGASYGHTAVRLRVDHTGCASGARWCLHDAVITTKPHNPQMYDLGRDYVDFVGRPVQTGWIDAVASYLH